MDRQAGSLMPCPRVDGNILNLRCLAQFARPTGLVQFQLHAQQLFFDFEQEFLAGYGIKLDTVKVLVKPRDERMKALISLRAFGLTEIEAVRYYTAMLMAERGVVSAPNMAIGQPFFVGGLTSTNFDMHQGHQPLAPQEARPPQPGG